MKKTFQSNDWLPAEDLQGKPYQPSAPAMAADDQANVELAVAALETAQKDITPGYGNWLRIGFSLAQLGEAGRDYFHRVSRLNAQYDHRECDRQFDRCLKSAGQGITLGSFFHLLKEAGIAVPRPASGNAYYPPTEVPAFTPPAPQGPPEIWMGDPELLPEEEVEEEEPALATLPHIPQEVFDNLPPFLKETVVFSESPDERDILLLGSLATLSSALPNLYGFYLGRKVYPHLYLFVTAPASAGKGQLNLCKNLVMPIQNAKREEAQALKEQYERELAIYHSSKDNGEKPAKPPEKMHFIPANNSTSGMFQLLYDNDCQGLIFETEGDTLTAAFKSDYGNYSDGFRRAFQHEVISYYRKTDREYVHLAQPKLATVLSGTPRQVVSLIPDAENGLFSRFLFYFFSLKAEWKDVFVQNGPRGIENHFLDLGEDFFGFYKELQKLQRIKIVFSKKQQKRFNDYFKGIQQHYLAMDSDDYLSSVRRLGLISFRIAMILTALRLKDDQQYSKVRQCEDRDFESVMALARVMVEHNYHVFRRLPLVKNPVLRSNVKEKFFKGLSGRFSRLQYQQQARELRLSVRTADKYISHFRKAGLLERLQHGEYVVTKKVVPED